MWCQQCRQDVREHASGDGAACPACGGGLSQADEFFPRCDFATGPLSKRNTWRISPAHTNEPPELESVYAGTSEAAPRSPGNRSAFIRDHKHAPVPDPHAKMVTTGTPATAASMPRNNGPGYTRWHAAHGMQTSPDQSGASWWSFLAGIHALACGGTLWIAAWYLGRAEQRIPADYSNVIVPITVLGHALVLASLASLIYRLQRDSRRVRRGLQLLQQQLRRIASANVRDGAHEDTGARTDPLHLADAWNQPSKDRNG